MPLSPAGTGQSLIGSGESACILNPSYAGSFFCQQYFAGRPSFGYEPLYPFWFPSTGYETEQPPSESDSGVAAQVANLAAEVEMMREEQALRDSRSAPPPAQPSMAEEKPPSIFLIFRDGHQLEVQNYAIVGKTFWVLSEQTARRIPLADLDLSATRQFNENRGVEFTAPDSQ